MLGAGIIERKQLLVRLVNAADYIDNYNAVADFCCGFNTVGKARFDFGFDNKAVDNNLDIMLLSFFSLISSDKSRISPSILTRTKPCF